MKWFPFVVIALILLGLGAFSAALSAGWWIERSFEVWFDAPPTVSWTAWVPAPVVGIPYAVDGVVQVQGRVESIHGTLLNVTGSGEATIRYTETTFALGTDPFAAPRGFNLSGLEVNQTGPERRFWVWRSSSDASANISVSGFAFWHGLRIVDTARCGDGGFAGPMDEGWTSRPAGVGDCVHLIAVPPPEVGAAALLVTGAIVAVVSLTRRSREPTA